MASVVPLVMSHLLTKFLHAGVRETDSLDARKMMRIANQFSLVTMGFFLLGLLINTLVLISLALNKLNYSAELIYYIPQSGSLILIALFYRIRVVKRKVGYFFGELYACMIFVPTQAVFMGEFADVHLLIFAGALMPIFFLDALSLRTMLLCELIFLLTIIALFVWFEVHPQGLMPPIEAMRIPTKIFFNFVFFSTNLLFTYYLWLQNHKSKLELIGQKQIVQQQNTLLIEKDLLMQGELDLASEIQKQILPPTDLQWRNVRVRTTYKPLGKVSGDYYEIKETAAGLFVMVADVSGHGVPAALVTMLCKQVFSDFIAAEASPAQVLTAANAALYDLVKMSAFISAFLVKIDTGLKLEYCNAGHNYPVYFSSQGTEPVELAIPGPAIGFLADASTQFQNRQLQLSPGDRIFMYTDGIVEQFNNREEQFGLKNFIHVLSETESGHKQLFGHLDDYRGPIETSDDMTLLSIEIQR